MVGEQQLMISQKWEEWKNEGDRKAKNIIIEHYLHLVDITANRMMMGLSRSVSKDDLISFGFLGLMDAVEKFDLKRGLQFETYASFRIRGAMLDGLRKSDWVPRSVREKAKKIDETYQILEQRYMRTVTPKEMSHHLQISDKEFQQMVREVAMTNVASLEEPIREEDSDTRLSLLVDEKAKNPDYKVNEHFLKEMLGKGIKVLTPKEKLVVSLLYYEELTLTEIAEVLSLSPSRISQLHSKALLRLKNYLAKHKEQLLQR